RKPPVVAADAAYANSMVGRSGVEVCPDRAVVQGTRESVRKRGWGGKMMLSGAQVKGGGEGVGRSEVEGWGGSGRWQGIRVRESRFMRPTVENEVESQKPRAFR